MILRIDTHAAVVEVMEDDAVRAIPFGDPEAFTLVSKAWLRVGWDLKYVYGFSWLGRPVIQLPEDMIRVQEAIYEVKPDVILETGIAHGGSLVFYASVCRALGHGRVIGVDVEIRPHNRSALEAHPLRPLMTLIEGDSVAPATVQSVRDAIGAERRVFVVLDSKHTKDHVRAELVAYAPLVSVGSYIVAADGIMAGIAGAPRTRSDWSWNNPAAAVAEFADEHDEFVLAAPTFPFNEGDVTAPVSYWQGGWLRRVR
jgi:cephalosporin hydroxylase